MDPYKILIKLKITEKTLSQIELENKLVFVTNLKANKNLIKKAFKEIYEEEVEKVNTLIDQKGQKIAFIKLKRSGAASDIATRLGVI